MLSMMHHSMPEGGPSKRPPWFHQCLERGDAHCCFAHAFPEQFAMDGWTENNHKLQPVPLRRLVSPRHISANVRLLCIPAPSCPPNRAAARSPMGQHTPALFQLHTTQLSGRPIPRLSSTPPLVHCDWVSGLGFVPGLGSRFGRNLFPGRRGIASRGLCPCPG